MKRMYFALLASVAGAIVAMLARTANLNGVELLLALVVSAIVLSSLVHLAFFGDDSPRHTLLQAVCKRYGHDWYDDPEKLTRALVFVLGGLPAIVHDMMPDPATKQQRFWKQWTNVDFLDRLGIRPVSRTPTVMILNVAIERDSGDVVTWRIEASVPDHDTIRAFATSVARHVKQRDWRGKAPA